MRILRFVVFLAACGNVDAPVMHDAKPMADARELDAPPDARLCATGDPEEQCRQIMLPRCDALERCYPADHNIKAQCILDTNMVCSANHLVMTHSDCMTCSSVWASLTVGSPPSCKTVQTENCAQCYGLASTNATCPEAVPPIGGEQ